MLGDTKYTLVEHWIHKKMLTVWRYKYSSWCYKNMSSNPNKTTTLLIGSLKSKFSLPILSCRRYLDSQQTNPSPSAYGYSVHDVKRWTGQRIYEFDNENEFTLIRVHV